MTQALFPYYERELIFIRQMAQEFARAYPAAAARLLLEPNRSGDPHVERLIESFAFLAGRIHHKLDDEFPELTDALLGILYPHYLAPIPSMALIQFDLDMTRGQLPKGFLIPRHSALQTAPVGGLPCSFRTTYPVTLWPIQVNQAVLQSPPFPPGFQPPRRTAAALRIELECATSLKFPQLALDKLRFSLNGDGQIVPSLYELMFNHSTRVMIRSLEDPRAAPLFFEPREVLSQVGFDLEDAMLPYPSRSFPGYRLLSEFFAFPRKFTFFDLGGWDRIKKTPGFERKIEVVFFLDRHIKSLEEWIDAGTFRLGCTPIVNLFRQVAEPVPLKHLQSEYRITPDVGHPYGKEIYSIDSVSSVDPTTSTETNYEPFYSYKHGQDRDNLKAFWYAKRRESYHEQDAGSEMFISLVDLDFNPKLPAAQTLIVETTCTNRNLPSQLQHAGEDLYMTLLGAAPLSGIRCLRVPTSPMQPPLRRGAYWGLISHLSLNHLSITDPVDGRHALQEILRLYDFADAERGQQQQSEVIRQIIEGISSVTSKRVVGRIGRGSLGDFCRGVEVTVEFEEQKYVGTGVYLFASVLERFLALYSSINSFTKLTAKLKGRDGIVKSWPPRAGEKQLL